MIPDTMTTYPYPETLQLLKDLIRTPSFSREEQGTAKILHYFFGNRGIPVFCKHHNVWVKNRYFKPGLPTILLNSHHDTVRPNSGYTLDPFAPLEKDGKLFGLGSNDAGGALAALTSCFLHFYERSDMKYNLILAITAEEENSGKNGIESILPKLAPIDFAIVGEPTGMQLAIAEKGLLVLDCVSHGTAAHAAHDNPDNAIINGLDDIQWFTRYQFPRQSELLGAVRMNVTQIRAGSQHNCIPERCEFTVDIRTTDVYSHQEILDVIQAEVRCEATPRSLRLNPSSISREHPIVQAGIRHGRQVYGSPTISDQALIPCPSLKLGPGDSRRSHSSDEFIYLHEIQEGIELYIAMLSDLLI